MRADFSTQRRGGSHSIERALLVVSAGVLVWSGIAALIASRDLSRARSSIQRLSASAQREHQRAEQIDGRRRDRGGVLARQARQTLAIPPSRVLADLAETVPGAARLEALTLDYGGDEVRLDLRLLTRTPAAYDEFVARLTHSQRFGQLSFGDEKRTPDMKVSLSARYHEADAP